MKKLEISSCVGTGKMKHLKGSAVASSIEALILHGGQTLEWSDLDAIGSFSMRELVFYHGVTDARDHSIAKLFEHKKIADRLQRLHVKFTQGTGISADELDAVAGLENLQVLSLLAEKSECKDCISRVLKGMSDNTKLKELAFAFENISPTELDPIASLSIESLALSCKSITGEHLSRVGAGAAGSSITSIGLKNADVNSIFDGLSAFKSLDNLRLVQYTASANPEPEFSALLAGLPSLRRLELVNEQLLPPLEKIFAAMSNIEELVLSIKEVTDSELASILADKHELKALEITNGKVAGGAVHAILGLDTLTSLKIQNVAMSYDNIVELIKSGNLQRRVQNRLRPDIKVPLSEQSKIDYLRYYDIGYSDGKVIS